MVRQALNDPHAYTRDILALGDFNLPRAEAGDPIYEELTQRGLRLPEYQTKIGTTIAGDSVYDQVAYDLRRVERLSPAQRSALGLTGEVAAYEWLARMYPDEFTPSCWRSSYCAVDGIPGGSDDLGYDFAVVLKTKAVYFEVKATMGDLPEFELGDSEVKRARACTGRGRTKEEYQVLFVSHVLDSRRRRLDVLPNPLDPAFQTFYRFPGAGLRCLFQPA